MKLLGKSIILALVTALLVPMMQSFAGPPINKATTIRSIEDFLDRQGTFCLGVNFEGAYVDKIVDGDFVGSCPTENPALPFLIVAPIANFIGNSDPDTERSASVDYAGLADYWAGGVFGTTFSGQVIERPLADGRALVEVLLHTDNALTWVVDGFDFNGDLLFGNRAPEVDGPDAAEAALGKSNLKVKFINTEPGAELPDLIQLFFLPELGQELLSFHSNNQAKGPLKALFGVPAGKPGLTHGVQVGLIGNPQCGADSPSAVADCFPAERIELQVVKGRP
jgi:hypothetical protein